MQQNEEAKRRKQLEDQKQAEESAKINADKKRIADFWNSLSEEDQNKMRTEAKENAMKRHNKDEAFMALPYAKPMIQAEL